MRELLRLTPVYREVEDGWTQATLRELPGVITVAPTFEQAEELLIDALREFLMSFSEEPPDTSSDDATLTIAVGVAGHPAA